MMKLSKLSPIKGIEMSWEKDNPLTWTGSVIGTILSAGVLAAIIINLSTEPALYRALFVTYIVSMTANFYYWEEL